MDIPTTMVQHKSKTFFWLLVGLLFIISLSVSDASRISFLERSDDNSRSFLRLGRFELSREGDDWQRVTTDHTPQKTLGITTYLEEATSELIISVESSSSVPIKGSSLRGPETTASDEDDSKSDDDDDDDDALAVVSNPIIASEAFKKMTGEEFEDPKVVDQLARSGFEMCTQEGTNNEWIHFKAHRDTEKILKEQDNMMSALKDGKILVYIGNAQKEGFGSQLPIIKTISILPLSAQDMAELLLDSSKVKIYNKLSLGRKDVRTFGKNTKIVCNLTKPPVAKSSMVSVTLMHSRPLGEDYQNQLVKNKEGYLVVSRAAPGMVDKDLADLPRNDILLGVNLLQNLGPDECLMTAVTHVYSPVLPTMLAKGMGVSSAINFVKDIRRACQPVSN